MNFTDSRCDRNTPCHYMKHTREKLTSITIATSLGPPKGSWLVLCGVCAEEAAVMAMSQGLGV